MIIVRNKIKRRLDEPVLAECECTVGIAHHFPEEKNLRITVERREEGFGLFLTDLYKITGEYYDSWFAGHTEEEMIEIAEQILLVAEELPPKPDHEDWIENNCYGEELVE